MHSNSKALQALAVLRRSRKGLFSALLPVGLAMRGGSRGHGPANQFPGTSFSRQFHHTYECRRWGLTLQKV